MDTETVAERIKNHPVLVIGGFVVAVLLPIWGHLQDWFSSFWASCIFVGLLCAIVFLLLRPKQAAAQRAVLSVQSNPDDLERAEDAASVAVRDAVRSEFISGMEERQRRNYFHKKYSGRSGDDTLYREAIESKAHHPEWGYVAAGVDEWVSIGFETLSDYNSGYRTSGTVNRLYRAGYDSLLDGDLPIKNGPAFARMIAGEVASRRRSGH